MWTLSMSWAESWINYLNMFEHEVEILEVEIDSWRLRDHQRFQFHAESTRCWMSRQLQNYHFLRCSKVSIVKLPWSPWFSMSQVSLLSWLVESTFMIGKMGLLAKWWPENDVLLDPFCNLFVNFSKFVILWDLSQCLQMCYQSNLSLSFCWRWFVTFFFTLYLR